MFCFGSALYGIVYNNQQCFTFQFQPFDSHLLYYEVDSLKLSWSESPLNYKFILKIWAIEPFLNVPLSECV